MSRCFCKMKLHPMSIIMVIFLCNSIEAKIFDSIKPKIIMGNDFGQLKRCKYSDPNACTMLSEQKSPIKSAAVAGEFVYIGLQSGELRRCSLFRSSNCTVFQQLNSGINAIAVFGKNLYIGSTKGITKCGLRKSESCELFYESDTPIYSLTTLGDELYAGTDDLVLKCSESNVSVCVLLTNTTSAVNAITASFKYLYLGMKEGSVQSCELKNVTDCYMMYETESEVLDLDIYEKYLLTSLESGEIMRFSFETLELSTIVEGNSTFPVSTMSIIYDTKPVYRHYVGESNECVWQFTACPPFVVYYDVQSRAALELHVKNNLVYTAEGELFDTDQSDFSHSAKSAIFVMDAGGKIFASSQHPIGLIHHSSLMSGKPAAAAGEIKANQGEIEMISSCSGHYRPSIRLTRQIVSSLRRQGYSKNVTIKDCFGATDLLIDLDYKKTDLYYEAQYKKYSEKMKNNRN